MHLLKSLCMLTVAAIGAVQGSSVLNSAAAVQLLPSGYAASITLSDQGSGPMPLEQRPYPYKLKYVRHEAVLQPPPAVNTNYRKDLLKAVNVERAKYGVPPVCLNANLSRSAQLHSEDMAKKVYFNHTSLDGRAFYERIANAGFKWNAAGETIGAGQPNVSVIMTGWMNSTGHRPIILNKVYRFLGAGYAYDPTVRYKHYWTLDFGNSPSQSCDKVV